MLSIDANHHLAGRAPLRSARLALRPVECGDAEDLHTLVAQPGVRRYLFDGATPTLADAREMATDSVRLHAASGIGLWRIVRDAGPDAWVGIAGFWPFAHATSGPELLFALAEEHWGRGYATEAGGLLLSHARDALGWFEAHASTDLGNNASIRTLWRLGFTDAGLLRGDARTLRLFRRAL
jgi:[ribosomal protein S5]-alanine N-acetyltransferase